MVGGGQPDACRLVSEGDARQYCWHIVAARRVAQLIAKTEKARSIDVGEYDQSLKMQEREGRAISSLAARMRAEQTRKPTLVEKPWA
jgi:hypothetical protein